MSRKVKNCSSPLAQRLFQNDSTVPKVQKENTESKGAVPKKKRQFYVEQGRKEIDDYMINRIQKNKKSIKRLQKQIDSLKAHVTDLRDQSKKRHSEYHQISHRVKKLENQRSIAKNDETKRRSFCTPTTSVQKSHKLTSNSRDNSVKSNGNSSMNSSRRSQTSLSSQPGKLSGVRTKKGKESDNSSSRWLLSKKIQQLKAKAGLKVEDTEMIRLEVNRKIAQKLKSSKLDYGIQTPTKDKSHSNYQQRIQQERDEGYQELLRLLRTNKKIEDSSQTSSPQKHPPAQKQIKQASFQIQNRAQKTEICLGSQKSLKSTNKQNNFLKCSATFSQYYQQPKFQNRYEEGAISASETNLLQSDPFIPQKIKRQLKMSRCLQVQVAAEQPQNDFQCIFQLPKGSRHINEQQCSFEQKDASKRKLKQLQFQFDQLVRQQLLSNDSQQKLILGHTIRTILSQMKELKDKIASDAQNILMG